MTRATLKTHDCEVTIEVPFDDLNIDALWEKILEPLLLGAGYHAETVSALVSREFVIPREE